MSICKEHNIKLAILGYDPGYSNSSYDRVMGYVNSSGVPLLDLRKTRFHSLSFKSKYVEGALRGDSIPINSHANKYGCKVVADELADFLKRLQGYLYD
jgi:hypothetical protein